MAVTYTDSYANTTGDIGHRTFNHSGKSDGTPLVIVGCKSNGNGGTALPIPSTYTSTTATLVDSARNVKGVVVGSVIRNDVAKISLTWKYLTSAQWAEVLGHFAGKVGESPGSSGRSGFYQYVHFYNQVTGSYDTRRMYVSDRSADVWRHDPNTGAVLGYTGCSLDLVEV